jgi:hypothetical protein
MYRPQDIRDRLHERPFRPLRLVLTTGQTYDIDHPDLLWVTQRDVHVGLPNKEDPTLPDQTTRVAILHIVELRDLPAQAPTPGNGPATP